MRPTWDQMADRVSCLTGRGPLVPGRLVGSASPAHGQHRIPVPPMPRPTTTPPAGVRYVLWGPGADAAAAKLHTLGVPVSQIFRPICRGCGMNRRLHATDGLCADCHERAFHRFVHEWAPTYRGVARCTAGACGRLVPDVPACYEMGILRPERSYCPHCHYGQLRWDDYGSAAERAAKEAYRESLERAPVAAVTAHVARERSRAWTAWEHCVALRVDELLRGIPAGQRSVTAAEILARRPLSGSWDAVPGRIGMQDRVRREFARCLEDLDDQIRASPAPPSFRLLLRPAPPASINRRDVDRYHRRRQQIDHLGLPYEQHNQNGGQHVHD